MAQAVDRPKSTVAYHVNLLLDTGLLRVVRTRRVRAIQERYYGRVARTVYIGALSRPQDKQVVAAINGLAEAAAEAAPAHAADQLRCSLVHARIPVEEVRNFWAQVQELTRRFAQIPRAGDQVCGLRRRPLPHRRSRAPRRRSRPDRLTRTSARTDAATSASVQRLLAALPERTDRPFKCAIHRQPAHRELTVKAGQAQNHA